MTEQPSELVEILRSRDKLLVAVQRFIWAVDAEDFSSMTVEQQMLLQDVAMHAGCTYASWWGAAKSELKGC